MTQMFCLCGSSCVEPPQPVSVNAHNVLPGSLQTTTENIFILQPCE